VIDPGAVVPALPEFLRRQRWFAGSEPPRSIRVLRAEVSRVEWPGLMQLVVDADGAQYQVLVGLRPIDQRPEFLGGREESVIADLHGDDGPVLAYDATVDPALGLALLELVSEGREAAERVRPVGVEQSNTSLVYDDRLILKLFRRLQPGPNPEVEVTEALAGLGFAHVAAPLASSTWEGGHLAVLQPYLIGGTEGWAMALTSLRDLFGMHDTSPLPIIDPTAPPSVPDPAEAGGDFSGESERLGVVTAELHLCLAEAFGVHEPDVAAWADSIEADVASVPDEDLAPDAGRALVESLRSVADAGASIRVHGDYHLAQVMRTDTGWFILDFEGEPARPVEERRRPSSPLRDVAGMLRSFHYASMVALDGRDDVALARAWEERNRQAFLHGYLAEAKKGAILPSDQASIHAVLRAFELEKSVYELNYERSHRPDWVAIPRDALTRITKGTPS
jgi:maltokinase